MRDADIMELARRVYEGMRYGVTASAAEHINAIAAEIRKYVTAPTVKIDTAPTDFDRRHMAATIAGGIIANTDNRAITNASTTTNIARNALMVADAIIRESKGS